MTTILPNADVFVVRDAIRDWVKKLANNDYEGAAASLGNVPGVSVAYDASTIQAAIGRYSPDYRDAAPHERDAYLPVVTALSNMPDGSGENMVIYYAGDSTFPTVEYDMPLDGEWSDLTAQFRILSVDDGYALGLQDIRVL